MSEYPVLYCLGSEESDDISLKWYIANNSDYGVPPQPKGNKATDSIFIDSDGKRRKLINKFEPFTIAQSKHKEATAIVYCNTFADLVGQDETDLNQVYINAQINEVVTIIDINPNDHQFGGNLGWCKIRNHQGEEKFYPICYLQFDDNF